MSEHVNYETARRRFFRLTDNLTGVYDHLYFQVWISSRLWKQKRTHILTVDLCKMRQINAIFGTSTGDQVLCYVARRFREILGTRYVFRISGNRFLLAMSSLREYERTRDEIVKMFQSPFVIRGEEITFPAIICGVLNVQKMQEADSVLSYVEYLTALVPKAEETVLIQGDEETERGFIYKKEVEAFLYTAVDQDLFDVHYQPVYSMGEDRFVTLEALSRLYHPTLGPVSPDIFIRVAEKNGLIDKIGKLQFQKVCRFVAQHPELLERYQNVKFNLSPAELLKPGHGNDLMDIIEGEGLPYSFFQFEITETVATEYSEEVYRFIEGMMERGAGLCLDDFGAGYANLSSVLKLPFSCIKLDRSLLKGILEDKKAAAFYKNIALVLREQGYQVVSEGVETQSEARLLEKWGIDQIQGYWFSRPLPEKAILELT